MDKKQSASLSNTVKLSMPLIDHSVPRKDGITATKEIRELEAASLLIRRQTIIAVTAASGPEAQSSF